LHPLHGGRFDPANHQFDFVRGIGFLIQSRVKFYAYASRLRRNRTFALNRIEALYRSSLRRGKWRFIGPSIRYQTVEEML